MTVLLINIIQFKYTLLASISQALKHMHEYLVRRKAVMPFGQYAFLYFGFIGYGYDYDGEDYNSYDSLEEAREAVANGG